MNASVSAFMANLLIMVQKNIKLLLRAKSSALIVIGGPLFIILFAGIAFDHTNIYAVSIGAFSPSYNDLSNSFLERLSEKNFKVVRYPDAESCRDAIKKGEINTCAVFSKDFALAKEGANELSFFVDYSQINLVWTIVNTMTERVTARSIELSENLTSIVLNALDYSRLAVTESRPDVITLTTENDEIGRRVVNIQSELSEIELGLDPNEFAVSNLSKKKASVKHWIDNSLGIAKESLDESVSFIDATDELVQGSAAGGTIGQELLSKFIESVDEINALKGRLDDTELLVNQEFGELQIIIDTIIGKITQTKAIVDHANSVKEFSVDELDSINKLLDKSLVNILDVQKTLNSVEKTISSIEVKDASSIVQPIITTIKPVVAEKSYLNYIFPTIVSLILMFTALLLAPTLIMLEKNSPAYFRNYMTPAKKITFFLSIFLTCIILLSVQVLIILGIAGVFFSEVLVSLPSIVLVMFLGMTLFTGIGMIVGYGFTSEETAILGSISLGSVLLFLSDIIIPVESMPHWLGSIVSLNPVILVGELVRKTAVFGLPFSALGIDLLTLAFSGVVAIAFALVVYYGTEPRFIQKALSKVFKK